MSSGNKHPYPFMIVLGTLCCLGILSLISNSFSFGSYNTRPLDILADLKEKASPPEEEEKAQPAPATKKDSITTITAPVIDYATYPGIIDYGDQGAGMQYFNEALKALRAGQRKKVRIAYFGDSMIEGDLITQDLRDSLQAFFGGEGVGFVPATSIVSGFRTSIRHSFSPNWMDYSFKNTPPKGTELGISGHVFLPAAQSWIRYQPAKNRFEEVSLLYGSGGGEVTINNKALRLDGTNKLNAKSFISDTTENSLTLKFNSTASFYGACFESTAGVFLDNYSFRGISGIELGKLSKNMWTDMQSVRPYDLIVLHYGANVLFLPENTKFDWYERPMVKVVDSLRQLFPHTSFLIVGTADKAYKKKGKYVTAPGVKALMKIQHSFAESRGMAYWNLYSAMGGEGAMTRWVEGDTTYANKDYTHFNFRGASKVGALLYKAIMDDYKQAQF
jgi:hypothetical protein